MLSAAISLPILITPATAAPATAVPTAVTANIVGMAAVMYIPLQDITEAGKAA